MARKQLCCDAAAIRFSSIHPLKVCYGFTWNRLTSFRKQPYRLLFHLLHGDFLLRWFAVLLQYVIITEAIACSRNTRASLISIDANARFTALTMDTPPEGGDTRLQRRIEGRSYEKSGLLHACSERMFLGKKFFICRYTLAAAFGIFAWYETSRLSRADILMLEQGNQFITGTAPLGAKKVPACIHCKNVIS